MLKGVRTLYVSGEESEQQIKMRADRLKIQNDEFYLLTETSTQTIFQEIRKLEPQLVIIDSIQTLQSPLIESAPGSVSQIRETAAEMQRFAKESNTPFFSSGISPKTDPSQGQKSSNISLTPSSSSKETSITHTASSVPSRTGSVPPRNWGYMK